MVVISGHFRDAFFMGKNLHSPRIVLDTLTKGGGPHGGSHVWVPPLVREFGALLQDYVRIAFFYEPDLLVDLIHVLYYIFILLSMNQTHVTY